MSLRAGHRNVDQNGLVSMAYLQGWSAASHNLVELVANMSTVFGAEPPVRFGYLLPCSQAHNVSEKVR